MSCAAGSEEELTLVVDEATQSSTQTGVGVGTTGTLPLQPTAVMGSSSVVVLECQDTGAGRHQHFIKMAALKAFVAVPRMCLRATRKEATHSEGPVPPL